MCYKPLWKRFVMSSSMNIETVVKLNKFTPRSYQLPIMDALVNKGYRRVLAVLPRRAGKDITAWNLCIRSCLKKPCVIYYIFPTYAQAKKVIWDSITNSGERFLDYIPEELIESTNSQELKIRFKNGSLLQLVGSDSYDSLMGTNPQGVVFSEYALQDPRAYQYMRPILTANDGWALFISTPRGKNHMWELYNIAKQSSEWFCYKLTVEDTNHIPLALIEKEKQEGIMSDDLIQQEYYTSFEMGVEGAYYTKYLDRMRVKGQIGMVPWESGFKVHTAWDLGVRDSTAIIFFQTIGQTVRIIDYYEKNKEGLEHYITVLENKPYSYGKHIGPHDIRVQEFGSGLTRIEKARQLGIKFTVADDHSIMDGIEAVRSTFSKMWIDDRQCASLINSIENYRQEYDSKRKVYNTSPLHNFASHACFIGETPVLTRNGMHPIMSLKKNDEVLTLSGWNKCLSDSQLTMKNANLVEVLFKDGTTVKCTPEHLFLTAENEWKYAQDLEKGSKIQSFIMNLFNTLREMLTNYGPKNDIIHSQENHSIEQCGQMRLVIYQLIAMFITKITIPTTITSGIWNVCPNKNILNCLNQILRDGVKELENLQHHGMDPKKEENGIANILSKLLTGLNGNENQEIVSTVEKNFRLLLEVMGENNDFATLTVEHPTVESVKKMNECADVWDIAVEKDAHFSLANGAIVHNCDALRYLAVSLPKTRDSLSPEELDKRYESAVLGQNQNLPSIFRTDLPQY